MSKTANDLFAQERQVWVDDARAVARKLLMERTYITINDVLKKCPRPTYLHRNTNGQVFRHKDFKTYGFEKSKAKLAKGRIICQWQLDPRVRSTLCNKNTQDGAFSSKWGAVQMVRDF